MKRFVFLLLCVIELTLCVACAPLSKHPHDVPIPIPSVDPATSSDEADADTGDLVLTKLIVIARHGHRAPNAPYWSFCPNDRRNRRRYNVDPEDLSARGMREEYKLGQHIRRRYRRFLGKRFNRTQHFFRAVVEPRILQSAVATAQGMFPDGFGPSGYLPSRPQFVPVFSDMDTHEYLLDDVPCFRRAERDVAHWINNSLAEFLADPEVAAVTAMLRRVCGNATTEPATYYAYVKTVTDGMTFNTDFGLSVCGGAVTPEMLFRIRNVSLQLLMARLYHTDAQQTYTAVDLPFRALRIMRHRELAVGKQINNYVNTRQPATFFFVHREALYAFSQFFGIPLSVPGIPRGELPVASAFIMEKLEPRSNPSKSDKKAEEYVRFLLWTPYTGTQTVSIPSCRVPQLCTLNELQNIYDERVKRTGTWDKLCDYNFSELDHNTDVR